MTLPAFNEALEYAKKRKIVLPQEFYDPKNKDRHGELMTISNLAGLSQIQAVTDDLMQALEDGETFDQWKKRALETDGVGSLPEGRLETVFRNYMQTAYSGGRQVNFEKNKATSPYLMYSAINDSRVRPSHAAMSGTIRPVDDPFWATHTPPCGHRCRCSLIAISKSQAEKRTSANDGLNKEIGTLKADPGWGYKPTYEGQAEALTHLLAEKLQSQPKSEWARITDVFMELWAMLGKLIRSLIPL